MNTVIQVQLSTMRPNYDGLVNHVNIGVGRYFPLMKCRITDPYIPAGTVRQIEKPCDNESFTFISINVKIQNNLYLQLKVLVW